VLLLNQEYVIDDRSANMPIVINFEDVTATTTPPFVNRPGALTELKNIKRGVQPVDIVALRFDVVNNIGEQAKPSAFGQRSLDPYFNQQDATPFTLDLGSGERGYLANTISITMGDYGEDIDNLSIQLFDDEWRLLGADSDTLGGGGTNFTSASLTAVSTEGKRVRYVRFIGGSAAFPHSVFYDNIVLSYTPTEADLNGNPLWGEAIGQAVANKIIDDALNRQAEYLIEDLIEQYSRGGKAIRAAAEAFRNSIGGLAAEVADATYEKWVEALKEAAVGTALGEIRGAAQIPLIAYEIATNANTIAQETGRNPLSKDVLTEAGAETLGDRLLPGIGGEIAKKVTTQQEPIPERNSMQFSRSRRLLQDEFPPPIESSINKNKPRTTRSKTIQGSSKNDKLSGTTTDDHLFGRAGNDNLSGRQGWDGLIGDIGNDRLVGGDGSDMLNGCGRKFVAGEVDRLTGGTGVDLFVLGDPRRVYYKDKNRRTAGVRDYALLTDFDPKQDFIILKGKFDDYIFKRNKIFLNDDGVKGLSRNDELIAKVKGAVNFSPVDIILV
jgi:hypothetical protein